MESCADLRIRFFDPLGRQQMDRATNQAPSGQSPCLIDPPRDAAQVLLQ
ncbi:hypothetical protein OHA02_24915 [Streptomyces phaeochromogenes]|nr:hypothetical protein [Streptomyces phaeochromogenes]